MNKPLCLCAFVVQMLLTGCNTTADMSADDMRAGIDNCKDQKLGVLVYQRADSSVMAIRCLPLPEDVTQTITVRKRTSMPVIKLFYENHEIQEQ